jgi:hypothetical protein
LSRREILTIVAVGLYEKARREAELRCLALARRSKGIFDDPISDFLLVGILVSVFLHFRKMKLLQRRTNQLAFQVSELNALIRTISLDPEGFSVDQRAPSMRFDETTLAT